MRRIILGILAMGCVWSVSAETLVFSTAGTSTGDQLDNLTPSGSTVSVAEIPGLNLTATFGATSGTVDYLNATASQLGINSDLAGEGTSYFDTGEWLAFAFDADVNVTRFKFASFTAGDSVRITWDTVDLTLVDSDLNMNNEYLVNWAVATSDTIRFEALGKSAVTSTGGFGLVEMDVVPEPATIAMFGVGGLLVFLTRRQFFVGK